MSFARDVARRRLSSARRAVKRKLDYWAPFVVETNPAKRAPGVLVEGTIARLQQQSLVTCGDHSFGHFGVILYDASALLIIGRYCSIAHEVRFMPGGEHNYRNVSTYPFRSIRQLSMGPNGTPSAKGDIVVGNDVWIGRGAKVLSGVVIGDGAVVGAYSVVASSIPPYAVVAGNPAQVIRYRFPADVVNSLMELAWWDMDDVHVDQLAPLLAGDDMPAFIAAAKALKASGAQTVDGNGRHAAAAHEIKVNLRTSGSEIC